MVAGSLGMGGPLMINPFTRLIHWSQLCQAGASAEHPGNTGRLIEVVARGEGAKGWWVEKMLQGFWYGKILIFGIN